MKKLRWCPDVIHCHGWMTALAPLYDKKAYKDEPSFRDAKVVFSVYEDDFKSTLSDDFAAKLMLKGISKDLGDLKEPVDYAALCKLAVDYSDGVIQNSEKVDESIIEYARQSGKLVLDYQNPRKLCRCLQRVLRSGMGCYCKRRRIKKSRYDDHESKIRLWFYWQSPFGVVMTTLPDWD